MIADSSRSILVSSLGWVDGAELWCFNVAKGSIEKVPVGESGYLSLHAGSGDRVAIQHCPTDGVTRISVRAVTSLAGELASATFDGLDGDVEAWGSVPRFYVGIHRGEFVLFEVDRRFGLVSHSLPWYTDDAYDKGYQGIVAALELPTGAVLVTVQRDSHPVVFDPVTQQVVARITLAGRHGNPIPRLRPGTGEIWLDDFDTLVKLDGRSLEVQALELVQPAAAGTMQFIGQFSFAPSGERCLVMRPFSGDAVSLSAHDLRVRWRARLGGQPLVGLVASDGTVVARDWKTGALLRAPLKRTWRAV